MKRALKRLSIQKTCLGKARHQSEHAARIGRRNSGAYAADLDVYRCPFCSKWHAGKRMADH